jgi:hypothetical protein
MRKMAIRFSTVGLLLANSVSSVGAVTSFDGKWVGTAPEAGDCGQLVVTMTISDGKISGTVAGKHGAPPIDSGTVEANGAAELRYAKQGFRANVRFEGNAFRGNFDTFCGPRPTEGSRVP